jgi:hypothetical protein
VLGVIAVALSGSILLWRFKHSSTDPNVEVRVKLLLTAASTSQLLNKVNTGSFCDLAALQHLNSDIGSVPGRLGYELVVWLNTDRTRWVAAMVPTDSTRTPSAFMYTDQSLMYVTENVAILRRNPTLKRTDFVSDDFNAIGPVWRLDELSR